MSDNLDIPMVHSATPQQRKRYIRIRISTTIIIIALLVITIVVSNLDSDSSSQSLESKLLAIPDPEKARNNSQYMTSFPHILGSENNTILGEYFQQQLQSMNIKNTTIQYHIVNVSRYNNAEAYIFDSDDESIALNLSEAIVDGDPTSITDLRHQAFLGFSSSGDISGNLLYVNYAHRSDFQTLETLGINLTGAIGICRYGGGMFRGVKADQADQFGLSGLIIYSDPQDDGFVRGPVFPNGAWMPSTGYQRGSVRYTFKCPGNVNPNRLRDKCDMDITQVRPNIPLIAMSYGNAQLLMQNMVGFSTDNPDLNDWQGGMNFVYHTGVNNNSDPQATRTRLLIENSVDEAEISNVFGFIPGSKYTDETILIGGHRDAWVLGAADPISGQTSILEIARTFGTLIERENWRPLRNIMFASWDAEEQSLIGSVTFTEVNQTMVESTIISYLNMDVTVSGPIFGISADPLIATLVIESMKKIPQPYRENNVDTLYSVWKERLFPNINDEDVYTGILGSGSDFVPFYHHYGISGISGGIGGEYGTYHSVYDSFVYMKIVDPEWERAIAMAKLYALITFEMVNNEIIPFDVNNLFKSMERWIGEMDNIADENECDWRNIVSDAVETLEISVNLFGEQANIFSDVVDSVSVNDDESIRRYNEVLKLLTRQFLIDDGLPGRKYFKNVLVGPNILSGYSAHPYPYIVYSFQFNCTAEYVEETIQQTVTKIDEATAFIESYLN
eukprot:125931_1